MKKRIDKRYIRRAGVQDRSLDRSEAELILKFRDYSCESTNGNEVVVSLNRYSVRNLVKAINYYKREMTKHYAEESDSIKRMCETTEE